MPGTSALWRWSQEDGSPKAQPSLSRHPLFSDNSCMDTNHPPPHPCLHTPPSCPLLCCCFNPLVPVHAACCSVGWCCTRNHSYLVQEYTGNDMFKRQHFTASWHILQLFLFPPPLLQCSLGVGGSVSPQPPFIWFLGFFFFFNMRILVLQQQELYFGRWILGALAHRACLPHLIQGLLLWNTGHLID